jgi:hypothetical protein
MDISNNDDAKHIVEETPVADTTETTDVSGIDISLNKTTEEKVETVEKEEEVFDPKDLKQVLQRFIQNPDGKFPVTMAMKQMVICLTNVSSDSLGKIEKLLEKVFADKKLDIQDAPLLMILMQELFELYDALEFKKIKSEHCASLLKLIAHVVYTHKYAESVSEDESTVILKSFNTVIDTAVMLMDLKESIPLKKRCRSIFFCYK